MVFLVYVKGFTLRFGDMSNYQEYCFSLLSIDYLYLMDLTFSASVANNIRLTANID